MHRVTYYGLFTIERMNEWWLQRSLSHLEIESIASLMPVFLTLFNSWVTTWGGRTCGALNPLLMAHHLRNSLIKPVGTVGSC